MNFKKLATVAAASVGTAGMLATGLFVGSAFADEPKGPEPIRTNAAGLTFGPAMGLSHEEVPDLVLVIGDSGREGYVYETDLNPAAPSSPEEALATQLRPGDAAPVFTVYASDGKTKIDTFTVVISTKDGVSE